MRQQKQGYVAMKPSWILVFKVWWSTVWRAFIVNAIIGAIVYLVTSVRDGEPILAVPVGFIGGVVGLWITLWALREALGIHIRQ